MAGITSTGFVPKTLEEIRESLAARFLEEIDPALDLSADQPMGQILAIFSEELAEVWELLATLYGAFDPNKAEGDLLDALSALTGTKRQQSTKSEVTVTLDLNSGFTKGVGEIVLAVEGYPEIQFTNVEAVGPTPSAGTYDVVFQSVEFGPVVANAGTLTEVTPPISGLNSATNAADAILGLSEDTDTALRIRRSDELASPGSCTVDAIRADLLELDGVIEAFVFENVTETTDGNGVPPHAIEACIFDGITPQADSDDVRAAIWASKPSGVATYGNVSGTTPDALGVDRQVYFSRATVKPVYLDVQLTVDPSSYAGDAEVKAAIAAKAAAVLGLGDDVIALVLRAAPLSVAGVLDVVSLDLGFAPSPVGGTNLTIAAREIAYVQTANITVST